MIALILALAVANAVIAYAVVIGTFVLLSKLSSASTGPLFAVLIAAPALATAAWLLRSMLAHRSGKGFVLVVVVILAAGFGLGSTMVGSRTATFFLGFVLLGLPVFVGTSLLVRSVLPEGSAVFRHFAATAGFYVLIVVALAIKSFVLLTGVDNDDNADEIALFGGLVTAMMGIVVDLFVARTAPLSLRVSERRSTSWRTKSLVGLAGAGLLGLVVTEIYVSGSTAINEGCGRQDAECEPMRADRGRMLMAAAVMLSDVDVCIHSPLLRLLVQKKKVTSVKTRREPADDSAKRSRPGHSIPALSLGEAMFPEAEDAT